MTSSENLYPKIPDALVTARKVMLNIDQFDVGQSYVTTKVKNRYDDLVKINIQGGVQGIESQETLFNLKERLPRFAYVMTPSKLRVRCLYVKLPVIGNRD